MGAFDVLRAIPQARSPGDVQVVPAAAVRCSTLGPVSVLRFAGRSRSVARGDQVLPWREENSFHLLLNLVSYMKFVHGGTLRVLAGEAVLVDPAIGQRLELPSEYDIVQIVMPDTFLRQWLPCPATLLGRRIDPHAGWGAVLCAILRQLTPEFLAHAPLPPWLLADQLGALLALLAADAAARKSVQSPPRVDLSERIRDYVGQNCAEVSLTAGDVARALCISPRTLHRALAADGQTFGSLLMAVRVQTSMRMLTATTFKHVTTAEIGRRAGFRDASHFARVFRRHVGTTPSSYRKLARPSTQLATESE